MGIDFLPVALPYWDGLDQTVEPLGGYLELVSKIAAPADMPDVARPIRTEVILPPDILADASAQERLAADGAAAFNRKAALLNLA